MSQPLAMYNVINGSYCSYQRFDMQTRRMGQFYLVFTLSLRSYAFFKKLIFYGLDGVDFGRERLEECISIVK